MTPPEDPAPVKRKKTAEEWGRGRELPRVPETA